MPMPMHEPTDKDRKQVEALAGYGVQHEIIAAGMGLAKNTLYKHYRDELDRGNALAQGQIAKSMYERGVKDKDTGALIWLTKTRLGWKDTSRVEVSGPDGGPQQHVSVEVPLDLTRLSDKELDQYEALARKCLSAPDPTGD